MGKGAGAAAGGAAGVAGAELSGAVVGEVCATLVAVAPNIEAINAAASARLSREVLFMISARFPPVQALVIHVDRACEVIASYCVLKGVSN